MGMGAPCLPRCCLSLSPPPPILSFSLCVSVSLSLCVSVSPPPLSRPSLSLAPLSPPLPLSLSLSPSRRQVGGSPQHGSGAHAGARADRQGELCVVCMSTPSLNGPRLSVLLTRSFPDMLPLVFLSSPNPVALVILTSRFRTRCFPDRPLYYLLRVGNTFLSHLWRSWKE